MMVHILPGLLVIAVPFLFMGADKWNARRRRNGSPQRASATKHEAWADGGSIDIGWSGSADGHAGDCGGHDGGGACGH